MLTKNIFFQNFRVESLKTKLKRKIIFTIKDEIKNEKNLLYSFTDKYKYSYNKNYLTNIKKNFSTINIIGMGGSVLGSKAIYFFLKNKIKKKVYFVNNLINYKKSFFKKRKKLNIIISKSGNTLETIANLNVAIKKRDKNIIITENNQNCIKTLANNLKAEIVEHKNYIGGRYSVLSEVGMLPAELMGLEVKKFKRLNYLVNNKNFVKLLCNNVEKTLSLIKKKKFNSIILNFDENSEDLFKWYQQLISESLGKKMKGILPVVSNLPRDNHSMMQLYLDGPRNNFYTFFDVLDYPKNSYLAKVKLAQKEATKTVFRKKKIPFRCFDLSSRSETSLGTMFTFFMLETILLGETLKVNPFDQPAVELIKIYTQKNLRNL